MSRIDTVFQKPHHKALIAYVTIGYPSIESTLEIVPALAESGCDIVELGIPFSDPLADGTTIQEASFQALKNGITPQKCLDIAQKLRAKVDIPLIFMTYYNPVLHFGLDSFCAAASQAGIDGLIIPDLPPDEATALDTNALKQGIDLIFLLSPNSTTERIRLVAKKSRGFIYLVSLTGVTGARENLPAGLEDFVNKVKQETTKPLCVGFGISTPDQAQRVSNVADGVIVGSRLIQLIRNEETPYRQTRSFVNSLRDVL